MPRQSRRPPVGDGNLLLDRLPALLLFRRAECQVLEFRELLLAGQRLSVPNSPRSIIVLALEPACRAVENDGDFPQRKPPEARRVEAGLDPRSKQRQRI